MTSELQQLIVEQRAMLTNIEKVLRNTKKDSASRKTEVYIRTRLESVAQLHLEFRQNHRTLMRASDTDEVNEGYVTPEIGEKFEEVYIDLVSLLRSDLPTPSTTPPAIQEDSRSVNSLFERSTDELKLPTVKLPVFSGKFTDWPAFKEVFEEHIHKYARFSNLYRFYYLKDSLSEEAARDIQHLSITEANYPVAWQMLINIYDNKRVLFVHYMDMFEQQPSVAHDDPAALKQFIQTCRSCVNSIDHLGVDLKQNQILVYLMARKLSNNARLEWEKSLSITQNIPTFEQFCAYLDAQYRTMITASTNAASASHQRITSTRDSSTRSKREVKTSFSTGAKHMCVICKTGNHPIRECSTFLNMQMADRKSAIGKHKLCFNCLGYNHIVSRCPSRHLCNHCGGHHHTLIHVDRPATAANSTPVQRDSNTPQITNTSADVTEKSTLTSYASNCEVLLPTAVVSVQAKDGAVLDFRVFLDQGSQVSFITERASQMLRLRRKEVHVRINGLANMKITEASSSVNFKFHSKYNIQNSFEVNAYVLPHVGSRMPERRLLTDQWEHLKGLQLADPTYYIPQSVDLLLGSDIYDELMLDDIRRGPKGAPLAQSTALGFIISGKVGEGDQSKLTQNISVASDETFEELESLLHKFWELEDITTSKPVLSDSEKWCEEFFKSSHRRLDTGKYLVRLPLLSHLDPKLVVGSSYEPALKRLNQLQRRLSANPNLKSVYSLTIREYLELGQMKKLTNIDCAQSHATNRGVPYCYLSHHPVMKESSTTTKVRVVFDGSMQTSNGKSLNEILAVGPKLHTDLTAILINWRFLKYVFLTDVEKMYRCIDVAPEDAHFQRILWYNDLTGQLEHYMCTTVMFGTRSAPFTAIRTMQQLASDEAATYPLAVKVIKQQMYVDDILSGAESKETAVEIQNQVIGMLNSGTFQLRKWASNCPELLENIPMEHRELKQLSQLTSDETIKALGIYWNPVEDEFRFKINFKAPTGDPTKRKVLSTIARLFDPMGWLAPVLISAKIFMQRLWRAHIGWDQTLPSNLARIWTEFVDNLERISDIRISRFIMCNAGANTQLHIFCDASSSAYGAAAYLRTQRDETNYQVQLLLARCKVLPMKPQLTIPRAELCAAVLAVKIFRRFVRNCSVTALMRVYTPLSVIDLQKSLVCILRIVQRESFASEFKALSSGKPIPKDSILLSLNPCFDEQERVIRLGGRLSHALLSPNERHPYLLPSK
ncbi:uncharacterized protein LOC118756508, partial [Rhagoletis pomonella]|uniref:uncharacterized protein LOC118756508 n=1 Tax=Rhagoletis pomonella TaxID=28610 RepID=UPI0017801E70